ncbi:MAG: hypothetical protein NT098_00050 [Candidatus Parcubacteria bacterium]|nr:hypothetical protein [Candidatus Parcubacteria bacterium]
MEENIPGSQYLTFGEVKYVSIPSTANVRLFMNGYEEGSFTLEVETVSGDTVLSSTSFAGIPSNENTTATMSITAGGEIQNLSPLLVDVNGDGILEFTLTPKSGETVLPDLSPKKEESKPANGSVPVSFLSHKEEYLEVVPPFGGATSKYSDEVAVAPSSSLVIPLKKGIHESFELNVREDDTSPKTSLKEERSDGERGVFGEKMATSTPSIQPTDLLATPFFPKTKAVETTIAITLLGGVLWIIWRW